MLRNTYMEAFNPDLYKQIAEDSSRFRPVKGHSIGKPRLLASKQLGPGHGPEYKICDTRIQQRI